jgi:hypothetical protein
MKLPPYLLYFSLPQPISLTGLTGQVIFKTLITVHSNRGGEFPHWFSASVVAECINLRRTIGLTTFWIDSGAVGITFSISPITIPGMDRSTQDDMAN